MSDSQVTTAETPRSHVWWERLALIALLLRTFTLRLSQSSLDNDTYWHVATGRYIVTNGEIPRTDPFSWYGAAKGLAWTVQEWLYGVLAYGVHELGGFSALNVMCALFVAGIGLGVYHLIRTRTGSPLLALALTALATTGISAYGSARPQLLTNLLIVVVLVLLQHKKYLWTIPVVALAANLHGGTWPVFAIIIGVWTVGRDWRILPLALLAPLLNPKGFELIPYPFATLNYGFSQVAEFTPTALTYSHDQLYLLTVALLVLLVDFGKVRWRDGLLAAGFMVLGFSSYRHTVFWFIVVLPILAPYMSERIATIGGWLKGALSKTPLRGFATFSYVQLLSAWTLAGVAAVIMLGIPLAGRIQDGSWMQPSVPYPSEAALSYLRENGTEGVFTEFNTGGYLIYHGIQPFIDSRGDLYAPFINPGEPLMDDYLGLLGSISIKEFQEKYSLHTFVFTEGTFLEYSVRDNPNYERILSSEGTSIYKVAGSQ